MASGAPLSDDEIRDRLAGSLPAWRHEDGQIRRTFRTHSWKGTLMVVNTIGHLAEAAWHHPEILASFSKVEVRLWSHDVKGVTDRDLALAEKIEEVVMWRPGRDDGPLEGTPETDPRHAYIRHSD